MIQIIKLESNEVKDFRKLVEIFTVVFEHDIKIPSLNYLQGLLSNPNFMAFVVIIDGEIVGGLTMYVLHQYYSTKPLAYMYDLGIAPEYQGQGLGKSLIAEVCHFCEENGFDAAYVEAEEEDVEAVSFYRKTAYSNEMLARHFTYSFT